MTIKKITYENTRFQPPLRMHLWELPDGVIIIRTKGEEIVMIKDLTVGSYPLEEIKQNMISLVQDMLATGWRSRGWEEIDETTRDQIIEEFIR